MRKRIFVKLIVVFLVQAMLIFDIVCVGAGELYQPERPEQAITLSPRIFIDSDFFKSVYTQSYAKNSQIVSEGTKADADKETGAVSQQRYALIRSFKKMLVKYTVIGVLLITMIFPLVVQLVYHLRPGKQHVETLHYAVGEMLKAQRELEALQVPLEKELFEKRSKLRMLQAQEKDITEQQVLLEEEIQNISRDMDSSKKRLRQVVSYQAERLFEAELRKAVSGFNPEGKILKEVKVIFRENGGKLEYHITRTEQEVDPQIYYQAADYSMSYDKDGNFSIELHKLYAMEDSVQFVHLFSREENEKGETFYYGFPFIPAGWQPVYTVSSVVAERMYQGNGIYKEITEKTIVGINAAQKQLAKAGIDVLKARRRAEIYRRLSIAGEPEFLVIEGQDGENAWKEQGMLYEQKRIIEEAKKGKAKFIDAVTGAEIPLEKLFECERFQKGEYRVVLLEGGREQEVHTWQQYDQQGRIAYFSQHDGKIIPRWELPYSPFQSSRFFLFEQTVQDGQIKTVDDAVLMGGREIISGVNAGRLFQEKALSYQAGAQRERALTIKLNYATLLDSAGRIKKVFFNEEELRHAQEAVRLIVESGGKLLYGEAVSMQIEPSAYGQNLTLGDGLEETGNCIRGNLLAVEIDQDKNIVEKYTDAREVISLLSGLLEPGKNSWVLVDEEGNVLKDGLIPRNQILRVKNARTNNEIRFNVSRLQEELKQRKESLDSIDKANTLRWLGFVLESIRSGMFFGPLEGITFPIFLKNNLDWVQLQEGWGAEVEESWAVKFLPEGALRKTVGGIIKFFTSRFFPQEIVRYQSASEIPGLIKVYPDGKLVNPVTGKVIIPGKMWVEYDLKKIEELTQFRRLMAEGVKDGYVIIIRAGGFQDEADKKISIYPGNDPDNGISAWLKRAAKAKKNIPDEIHTFTLEEAGVETKVVIVYGMNDVQKMGSAASGFYEGAQKITTMYAEEGGSGGFIRIGASDSGIKISIAAGQTELARAQEQLISLLKTHSSGEIKFDAQQMRFFDEQGQEFILAGGVKAAEENYEEKKGQLEQAKKFAAVEQSGGAIVLGAGQRERMSAANPPVLEEFPQPAEISQAEDTASSFSEARKMEEKKPLSEQIKKDKDKNEITSSVIAVQKDAAGFYLTVDGKKTFVRGVVYQPVPDGRHITDYYQGRLAGLYENLLKKDAAELKRLGFNTIYVYHLESEYPADVKKIKEIFRKVYAEYGIRVIAGNWLGLYTHPNDKAKIKEEVRRMIEVWGNEEWILGYKLGNENNYYIRSGILGQKINMGREEYYRFMDELAGIIKEAQRTKKDKRPVILGNGDLNDKEAEYIFHMQYVDALGLNIYRPVNGLNSFLEFIKESTGKPVIITEFGQPSSQEGESAQGGFLRDAAKVIFEHAAGQGKSGILLGACIHEWSDQKWKESEIGNGHGYYGIKGKSAVRAGQLWPLAAFREENSSRLRHESVLAGAAGAKTAAARNKTVDKNRLGRISRQEENRLPDIRSFPPDIVSGDILPGEEAVNNGFMRLEELRRGIIQKAKTDPHGALRDYLRLYQLKKIPAFLSEAANSSSDLLAVLLERFPDDFNYVYYDWQRQQIVVIIAGSEMIGREVSLLSAQMDDLRKILTQKQGTLQFLREKEKQSIDSKKQLLIETIGKSERELENFEQEQDDLRKEAASAEEELTQGINRVWKGELKEAYFTFIPEHPAVPAYLKDSFKKIFYSKIREFGEKRVVGLKEEIDKKKTRLEEVKTQVWGKNCETVLYSLLDEFSEEVELTLHQPQLSEKIQELKDAMLRLRFSQSQARTLRHYYLLSKRFSPYVSLDTISSLSLRMDQAQTHYKESASMLKVLVAQIEEAIPPSGNTVLIQRWKEIKDRWEEVASLRDKKISLEKINNELIFMKYAVSLAREKAGKTQDESWKRRFDERRAQDLTEEFSGEYKKMLQSLYTMVLEDKDGFGKILEADRKEIQQKIRALDNLLGLPEETLAGSLEKLSQKYFQRGDAETAKKIMAFEEALIGINGIKWQVQSAEEVKAMTGFWQKRKYETEHLIKEVIAALKINGKKRQQLESYLIRSMKVDYLGEMLDSSERELQSRRQKLGIKSQQMEKLQQEISNSLNKADAPFWQMISAEAESLMQSWQLLFSLEAEISHLKSVLICNEAELAAYKERERIVSAILEEMTGSEWDALSWKRICQKLDEFREKAEYSLVKLKQLFTPPAVEKELDAGEVDAWVFSAWGKSRFLLSTNDKMPLANLTDQAYFIFAQQGNAVQVTEMINRLNLLYGYQHSLLAVSMWAGSGEVPSEVIPRSVFDNALVELAIINSLDNYQSDIGNLRIIPGLANELMLLQDMNTGGIYSSQDRRTMLVRDAIITYKLFKNYSALLEKLGEKPQVLKSWGIKNPQALLEELNRRSAMLKHYVFSRLDADKLWVYDVTGAFGKAGKTQAGVHTAFLAYIVFGEEMAPYLATALNGALTVDDMVREKHSFLGDDWTDTYLEHFFQRKEIAGFSPSLLRDRNAENPMNYVEYETTLWGLYALERRIADIQARLKNAFVQGEDQARLESEKEHIITIVSALRQSLDESLIQGYAAGDKKTKGLPLLPDNPRHSGISAGPTLLYLITVKNPQALGLDFYFAANHGSNENSLSQSRQIQADIKKDLMPDAQKKEEIVQTEDSEAADKQFSDKNSNALSGTCLSLPELKNLISVYLSGPLWLLTLRIFSLAFALYWSLRNLAAGIQIARSIRQQTVIKTVSKEQLPEVTVQIPCRNEPFEIVKETLDSVLKIEYPRAKLQIQIIDNSEEDFKDLPELKAFCENNGIDFIHRRGKKGHKARNLNMGLAQARGEILLLLDADSVAVPPDALLKVIPEFQEETTGYVQCRTRVVNARHNIITRSVSLIVEMVDRINMMKSRKGFVHFIGHHAFVRKKALEAIGGWNEYFSAEDTEGAFSMQKQGYCGKFADSVEFGELAPQRWKDLAKQRKTWAYGTAQVIFEAFMNRKEVASKINLYRKLDFLLFASFYLTLVPVIPLLLLSAFINISLLPAVITGIVLGSFTLPFLSFIFVALAQKRIKEAFEAIIFYPLVTLVYIGLIPLKFLGIMQYMIKRVIGGKKREERVVTEKNGIKEASEWEIFSVNWFGVFAGLAYFFLLGLFVPVQDWKEHLPRIIVAADFILMPFIINGVKKKKYSDLETVINYIKSNSLLPVNNIASSAGEEGDILQVSGSPAQRADIQGSRSGKNEMLEQLSSLSGSCVCKSLVAIEQFLAEAI